MNSFREILKDAKQDSSLFSTLDIENLLKSVDNEKNDYLENKTTTSIAREIYEKILEEYGGGEDAAKICSKLVGYRFVDEINELHKGKHVRWIRKGTSKLTNGGIVVNIMFTNMGTNILVKNTQNKFMKYGFNDSITFQKMNTEEQLIALAYDEASK
jgi:hypothetical protein